MKLFIFLVFALTVFAQESLLSSAVSDFISQVMEERSAEAAVGKKGCGGKTRRRITCDHHRRRS